jgi:hypothetical protein
MTVSSRHTATEAPSPPTGSSERSRNLLLMEIGVYEADQTVRSLDRRTLH